MVIMELSQLLKRLFFAHPMTPTLVTGGRNSSVFVDKAYSMCLTHYLSTRATLLLYQFIKIDVERLKIRYNAMIKATPSTACPV